MKYSEKEHTILAGFYESELYRIFRKHFLEARQIELAQAAPFSKDFEEVLVNRGRIMELREIERELGRINKTEKRREK